MMIVLLSLLQVERGTLTTYRMWMDVRFTSVVDILPIESGVGMKNEYCREAENNTIYHIGMHKCLLKPNT